MRRPEACCPPHDSVLDRVNIPAIMSKPAISVSPDRDIRDGARRFSRFNRSRAPVVSDGEVAGIVSLTAPVIEDMAAKRG